MLHFLSTLCDGLLTALLAVFLVRAVMSLLMVSEDNPIFVFVDWITEIFTYPMRSLFDAFGWGADSPVDLPYLATVVLLALVDAFV